MIPDIITDKKSLFAEDTNTELRAQMNWNRRISLIAGNLTSNSRSHASGVSARVYKNGVYGFSSVANTTKMQCGRCWRQQRKTPAF